MSPPTAISPSAAPRVDPDLRQLERRTWRNWLLLVSTCIVSSTGLAVAMAPLFAGAGVLPWPWMHTEVALLGGLSLLIAAFAWYLTQQQRDIRKLQGRLQAMHESELRWVREHAQALRIANAELSREIRERERAQDELRRLNESLEGRVAERTAAVERQAEELRQAKASLEDRNRRLLDLYRATHQFVDNVSHEFRTPLTVIREYAIALREDLVGASPEGQEFLDTIVQRVDDLSVMVNDILDISRIEADILHMSRCVCSVGEILSRVRVLLERKAATEGVALRFHMQADAPVYCDPEKIGRVIVNLVVNAVKFSEPGREVVVWARGAPAGDHVVIGVTDQGPGIPAEHLAVIFERFKQLEGSVRSSTKGFGLGLNIVRELVHLNLGDVQVESTPGVGSTFSFTVPAADPARLLPHYLERVGSLRHPVRYVSLVRLALAGGTSAAIESDVESVFTHQIRHTDLLFETGPRTWLLLAATNNGDVEPLLERIARGHDEAAPRLYGTKPFPELVCTIERTCSIPNESDQLLPLFLALHPGGGLAPDDAAALSPPVRALD